MKKLIAGLIVLTVLLSGCSATLGIKRSHPAPPAPRLEAALYASPGADWVWCDGWWEWREHSWLWVGGSFQKRPWAGAVWIKTTWNGRRTVHGRWR